MAHKKHITGDRHFFNGKVPVPFLASILFMLLMLICPVHAGSFESGFSKFAAHEDPVLFPDSIVLYDRADRPRSMHDSQGRYRLVNFWAVWCPPCIEEIPSLLSLEEKLKDRNFDVIFVSMDFPASATVLARKMGRKGLSGLETYYVSAFTVWEDFGFRGLPTSLILSPDNRVLMTLEGPAVWDSPEAVSFIEALLHS